MLRAEFPHGPQLLDERPLHHRPLLLQNPHGRVLLQDPLQKRCHQHRNSPVAQPVDEDGEVLVASLTDRPI